jgi:cell division protein ZapA (FtsZ GTPase activity inhibitor)
MKIEAIKVGKEYIHRGQLVVVLAIDALDELAYVRTRLGEESEARISELQEKEPR